MAGFTQRYHVHTLVWYEVHEQMESAILREKQLKNWSRTAKKRLIELPILFGEIYGLIWDSHPWLLDPGIPCRDDALLIFAKRILRRFVLASIYWVIGCCLIIGACAMTTVIVLRGSCGVWQRVMRKDG